MGTPLGPSGPPEAELARLFALVSEALAAATEVLGHSSFALTMDTYTHVMEPLMREAAEAMDRALGGH